MSFRIAVYVCFFKSSKNFPFGTSSFNWASSFLCVVLPALLFLITYII